MYVSVCMCVYLHTHMHVCVQICECANMCVCKYVCVQIPTHIHMACIYVFYHDIACVYVCVRMYVCVFAHAPMCVCAHIHTHMACMYTRQQNNLLASPSSCTTPTTTPTHTTTATACNPRPFLQPRAVHRNMDLCNAVGMCANCKGRGGGFRFCLVALRVWMSRVYG